jgi:asparagine synthetase B (glutamine-hydrolysing)
VCGIVVTHDVSDQAVAGAPPSERGAGPGGGPGGDGEATRMLERIRHRGPDGAGSHRVGPTWLGHRRLAIVDVEGGTQPLIDEHGNVLVGNGEIYNHAELRAELGPDQFTTSSDNETALRAVVAWGPEAIDRLRGMFAFAVSTADGTLLAARDPLGIKPLYDPRVGAAGLPRGGPAEDRGVPSGTLVDAQARPAPVRGPVRAGAPIRDA